MFVGICENYENEFSFLSSDLRFITFSGVYDRGNGKTTREPAPIPSQVCDFFFRLTHTKRTATEIVSHPKSHSDHITKTANLLLKKLHVVNDLSYIVLWHFFATRYLLLGELEASRRRIIPFHYYD